MSNYHIAWMAVLLLSTLALYYVFRFRPYCDRYAICVFLALALFYNYNTCFLLGMTLNRLPIQHRHLRRPQVRHVRCPVFPCKRSRSSSSRT